MLKFVVLFHFLVTVNYASAGLGGPFLLWGQNHLVDVKLPALRTIDENVLSSLYEGAKSILIFIRNSSIHLDKDDYPKLAGILASNRWSYLPQQNLPIEPFDYTSNLEIITLTGDYSQQDTEISGLYNDAVNTFGSGQVLAILACKDGEGHYLYKREANDLKTTTSEPEKTEEDFVYISQDGKGILYTTSALILHFNVSGNIERFEFKTHESGITFDDRTKYGRLSVQFKVDKIPVSIYKIY